VNIECLVVCGLVVCGVSAQARFSWEVEVYIWNTMNIQII
jgi:hypothetical protein